MLFMTVVIPLLDAVTLHFVTDVPHVILCVKSLHVTLFHTYSLQHVCSPVSEGPLLPT